MIAILDIDIEKEIRGWIIAGDTHDARRKAEYTGLNDLANELYNIEFPKPGIHKLMSGFTMLVD